MSLKSGKAEISDSSAESSILIPLAVRYPMISEVETGSAPWDDGALSGLADCELPEVVLVLPALFPPLCSVCP